MAPASCATRCLLAAWGLGLLLGPGAAAEARWGLPSLRARSGHLGLLTEQVVVATGSTRVSTADDDCHPHCDWDCGQTQCNEVCRPVCQPPKCTTTCPRTDLKKCRHVCKDPKCAVVCPPQKNHKTAPNCTTVCDDPKCAMECGQGGQGCETICDDPVCSFKCTPKECPQPDCKMKCQPAPASCTTTPPPETEEPGTSAGPGGLAAIRAAVARVFSSGASSDSQKDAESADTGVVAWRGLARVPAEHLGRTAQTTPPPTPPPKEGPPYAPGYAPAAAPAAA